VKVRSNDSRSSSSFCRALLDSSASSAAHPLRSRLPPGLPAGGRWAGPTGSESSADDDGGRGGGLRVRVLGIRSLVVLHWSPDLEKEGSAEGGGPVVVAVQLAAEARRRGSAAGRAGMDVRWAGAGGGGARRGSS
jgi:hypothetical protein